MTHDDRDAAADREDTRSLQRGIRLDLVIAVCALLVSTLATAASLWQSHVVAEQLSSQVWPYLSISTTYDGALYIQMDVTNDGLGPAIIRSAVLSVDGKPYAQPIRALLHLVPARKTGFLKATLSSLASGSVIRVGNSVRLFRVETPWAVTAITRNAKRFDLKVCYCSLLGNCWITSAQQAGDPSAVPSCPDVGASQLDVRPGT